MSPNKPDALADALRAIHQDLSFFFACAGSVSRDDMASMIRSAQKRVDGVQGILWPEQEPEAVEPVEQEL